MVVGPLQLLTAPHWPSTWFQSRQDSMCGMSSCADAAVATETRHAEARAAAAIPRKRRLRITACDGRTSSARSGGRASPAARHAAASRRTPVSYTHLRAHETPEHLVCRLLL